MSHLSVVVDISPVNWSLSEKPDNEYPLSLATFLSQLLVFLNAHVAAKHENSLAVFVALPGKSKLLFSSLDAPTDNAARDANSYPPFRSVDSTVVDRITSELDTLTAAEKEGCQPR